MSDLRAAVAAVKKMLVPTPHSLLPWLSDDELARVLDQPGGEQKIYELFQEREKLIVMSDDYRHGDPYHFGFDLDHWKDADALLGQYDLIWISGGKRASKSEYAAKRTARAAMTYGRGLIWCFHDTIQASRMTQQVMFWKYLPKAIRDLNNKRSEVFKIKWSLAGGFTEELLVLPNETRVKFMTYNQDPSEFQGSELGARIHPSDMNPAVPNIGAWCDENLSLPWYRTVIMRCASHKAKAIWTFSVLDGITRTVKQFLGTPKTIKSRPSELLADRVNVPGVPSGHMPYIQIPTTPNSAVIYFHTDLNVIGDNYDQVKQRCVGMPSDYIEMNAYGYARDTSDRAWPRFDDRNIIRPEDVPEDVTIYRLADPAGNRSWAMIWWAVDEKGRNYIIRDWPDARRHGDWAVPDDGANPNPDGKVGPAQRNKGYGIVQYKKLILKEETIDTSAMDAPVFPHQKAQLMRMWKAAGADGDPTEEFLRSLGVVGENIQRGYIDPRAGKAQKTAEKGGTCIIDEMALEQVVGGERVPRMTWLPAPGVTIDEGLQAVTRLLFYNHEKELIPLLNEPKLYVVNTCHQVIWMMNNYTAEGGEKGACKDFADLVRYGALLRLKHISGGKIKTTGGGAY